MADEITLTLPREPDFHRVAHLVLGGLAARMDLTVENLEDLQLALDAILDRTETKAGDITVRMRVDERRARSARRPAHRTAARRDRAASPTASSASGGCSTPPSTTCMSTGSGFG